ncbi:MAG: NADH-quinone oxidoreductase subunit G [Ignavibacteriales bacterium]|nr:MAG: NADH-quinone oxidoreductase subunit G [Ignavibacteriales bacterium]
MGKLTINNKEIEFKSGQTIIEVAADNGIDIPHFCWHPALSVSGNCRMCLVEIEKMPKLAIACSTLAADGMIVNSESDKAVAARNAVMEFFLINHPLDCPICDEAGECKLQDYAYAHSKGESRFIEEKFHKDKRVELGPFVMFDAERCISCSRCIRFSDEIAKHNQLTFVNRGDRVTIVTNPGQKFDNPYSLNVTDICPVGALTNRDFRFQSRVWDMSRTDSVCIGCSRGCNIEIWVRNNTILRLTPRLNEDVNSYWMCDNGRLNTFKFVNSADRVDGPHLKKEGKLIKVGYDEAIAETVRQLRSFKSTEVAFLGSPFATVEDNYLMVKFAKTIFNSKVIDFIKHIVPGNADDILIREDKAPNSLGAELLGLKAITNDIGNNKIFQAISAGRIKVLYCLEDDIVSVNAEIEKILSKLDLLIIHSTNFNRTTALADIVFPVSAYAEKNGTFVNFQGIIQRIKPAVSTIEIDRSMDGLSMSRLDKFGTEFDRWNRNIKIDARPSWKIIQTIAAVMGLKAKYETAEEVFLDITNNVEVFNGLAYADIAEKGVQLKLKSELV